MCIESGTCSNVFIIRGRKKEVERFDLLKKRKGVHQESEKDRRIYVTREGVENEKTRNREKSEEKREKKKDRDT